MNDDDLAAHATGIVIFWAGLLIFGMFIALFKRPKLMIPILVVGYLVATTFQGDAIPLVLAITAIAGLVLARS